MSETLAITVELAFDDFSLRIDEQLPMAGTTAIFGPSGSGKSTLLRVVAGFERASGRVALGRQVWLDSARRLCLAAHRRPVGYMFQDARLFAHLDVAGNLSYALKRHRGDLRIRLDDVIAAFDLSTLLSRRSINLSGGERQRVALARTLLTQPDLLLLDEPLAALDLHRKAEILPYLETLSTHFGVPTLYVTHAIDEVALLAHRVMVVAKGRVQAVGATAEIVERLDLQSLTGRFEAGVVIEAQVTGHDPAFRLTSLAFEGQAIEMPVMAPVPTGSRVRLRIRARDVALATVRPEALSIRNVLSGRVLELVQEDDSAYAEALVAVGQSHIRARITRAAVAALGLAPGVAVFALVKSVSIDHRDSMTRAGQANLL